MKKLSYKEKFTQVNREARITCIITAVIIAFWWLTAFGVSKETMFFNMPLWFIGSCIGTYILAIILVTFAVKKFFLNFNLDDEDTSNKEVNKKNA
ncbi:YhdT family protein [Pectinatus sottacetonis]|uniref:YhdT family protein n=1 Tax=Pectinatus sottacetonis TaxID=1002795 RepID=UPI0018C5EC87|nr:YhdT family protein [Pectinatus sottacetonis]